MGSKRIFFAEEWLPLEDAVFQKWNDNAVWVAEIGFTPQVFISHLHTHARAQLRLPFHPVELKYPDTLCIYHTHSLTHTLSLYVHIYVRPFLIFHGTSPKKHWWWLTCKVAKSSKMESGFINSPTSKFTGLQTR